uniref:BTB domain-containing protein n=1 Tax=Parastrongyloides trichosuri TaxID=131310 RepID=A0A0N4ZUU3_PARTI
MAHEQFDVGFQQSYSLHSLESLNMDKRKPFIYDDFSAPNHARSYPLVVGNATFYVNPGYLCEYSVYFEKFFNVKGKVDTSLLSNINENDFLELLRVLHYCPIRKPIDYDNVILCFNMATLFQMGSLRKYTERFINKVIETTDNVAILADIVTHLNAYDNTSDSYYLAINKLVKIEDDKFCCSDTWNHLTVDTFDDVLSLRYHYKKYKKFGKFYERMKNWMIKKPAGLDSF